jgi:bisphosphoglycerate-dependent phosphoglycerate mutase
MTNEITAGARLAVKGIREGLEAGKEVEALVKDIDNFATSEAQARAAMRRKAQVVQGDTTIVNAVDEWRRLKQVHDLEAQLKADVVKKYGLAEWNKIVVIKERMQKEHKQNFDDFGRDVKALRRLMWWCWFAAAIVTYFLWKYKLV